MGYIYLYGMILSSQCIKLAWEYPTADSYCEIDRRFYGVGGETGTAAVILASIGCPIKLAGSHLGYKNNTLIHDYFANKSADLTEMVFDENFCGVEDIVIIDKSTRTCFGEFARLFTHGLDWVEKPQEESVKGANVVGCDPFFGDEIAQLCLKHGKPYATIDCMHDSFLNKHCSVNAISHEFLRDKYPEQSLDDVHKLYTNNTDGLVIFTQGEGEVLYGRKNESLKAFPAFKVDVESTLGAGDSFKAGTIYGLYKGFSDEKLVAFATATAAHSCAHFPISLNPATLPAVEKIIASR